MTNNIDLADYYDLLEGFDWFYDYADDHKVWKKGNEQMNRLKMIAKQSSAHKTLFDQFEFYKRNEGKSIPRRPIKIKRRIK